MSAARRKRRGKAKSKFRRFAFWTLACLLAGAAVLAVCSVGYVRHPRAWLDERNRSWPKVVTVPLVWVGEGLADITDALGWTGHDSVYEYDEPAPEDSVFFAGAPRRTGDVQPNDISVLDRGEFAVGWSPSLRRPVWCAYHVTPTVLYPAGKRPNFNKDREADNSPAPSAYDRSGYDRGHMVPNHAIETRYGSAEQRKTFLMSNIAPQTAALNRGVWRNFEHRIADLWTARYGEIWVVVGCVPSASRETLSGSDVEVPDRFFQVIVAQEGLDVRALAVLFDQHATGWNEWAVHDIVSIDELEQISGLDFLPELPNFIQDPLEAERPTRLWPIRAADLLRLILLRYE